MAIDYRFSEGGVLGGTLLTAIDVVVYPGQTVANRLRLGLIGKGYDFSPAGYGEGEFRYIKFTGAVVAGDFVLFDNSAFAGLQIMSGAAGTGAIGYGMVGIAMASHPNAATTNDFGWVMIRGTHDGANVATGVTAGTRLGVNSGVAGRVLATSAGNKVDGAFERLIPSAANVGTVEINWPLITGNG